MGLSEGLQKLLANDYEQATLKLLAILLDLKDDERSSKQRSHLKIVVASRLPVMVQLQEEGFTFAHGNDWASIQRNFHNTY